jgi:hypothetical protein
LKRDLDTGFRAMRPVFHWGARKSGSTATAPFAAS